jgi:hypothetical protein
MVISFNRNNHILQTNKNITKITNKRFKIVTKLVTHLEK